MIGETIQTREILDKIVTLYKILYSVLRQFTIDRDIIIWRINAKPSHM